MQIVHNYIHNALWWVDSGLFYPNVRLNHNFDISHQIVFFSLSFESLCIPKNIYCFWWVLHRLWCLSSRISILKSKVVADLLICDTKFHLSPDIMVSSRKFTPFNLMLIRHRRNEGRQTHIISAEYLMASWIWAIQSTTQRAGATIFCYSSLAYTYYRYIEMWNVWNS